MASTQTPATIPGPTPTKRRVRYKQAAEYTGLPEGTLRALVCKKEIPHIRIGPRMVLLDLDALDLWLAARAVAVEP